MGERGGGGTREGEGVGERERERGYAEPMLTALCAGDLLSYSGDDDFSTSQHASGRAQVFSAYVTLQF